METDSSSVTETNQPKLRWYQYSLRSLMMLVTLFAILCSIFTVVMQKNTHFWRSPRSLSGGSGFDGSRTEYQRIECLVWKDHYNECYYAIAEGYVDFDPNLIGNVCSYTFTYDIHEGGKLKINGRLIEHSQNKRLLALNAFGQMEEITLSSTEQKVVCSSDADQIWNRVVLKRLYKREGKTDASGLVGHWTYCDNNGKLAYEGSYQNGKRDGKWIYYYQSGKVRAEIAYAQGKLDGECKYFDDQGELKTTVKWRNDYPVGQTVRQAGLDYREVRTPTTISGGKW